MSTRKTTKYTAEFKAEAIKLVTEQGLSYSVAARKLGIPEGTLATWVLKVTQLLSAPRNRVNMAQLVKREDFCREA